MKFAFFDFDGTITTKDSMFDFIRYAAGVRKFVVGMISVSPVMAAYKLGLITNTKAKEKLLGHFFAGWSEENFKAVAKQYALHRLPYLVKKTALKRIEWHKAQGHKVVVVSASADHWLEAWCNEQEIELISSKLEVAGGKITGRLCTKNCHGNEKVVRIKEKYDIENCLYIYAYGDTAGDKPMLSIANEKFYRYF